MFTSPPTVHKFSLLPHPCQHLLSLVFLMIAILTGVRSDSSLWFWFAFLWWLMVLSTFSCTCWLSVLSSLKNAYSDFLFSFKLDCLDFCYWIVWVLYKHWILTPLSNTWHVLWFIGLPFHFIDGFLCSTEAFQFDVVPHVYFCFLCQIPQNHSQDQFLWTYHPCFLLEVLWFQITCLSF